MKKLNTWQTLLFQAGGLIMVAGAALPMFGLTYAGAILLQIGSVMFGLMQLQMRYEGHNSTVSRLRRQQMLGALLLIVSGCLAVMHEMGMYHLGSGEWKLCLAVAIVMEGYTAFRLPNALKACGEDAD